MGDRVMRKLLALRIAFLGLRAHHAELAGNGIAAANFDFQRDTLLRQWRHG